MPIHRRVISFLLAQAIVVGLLGGVASRTEAGSGPTITVSGTQWGASTCYLGATEGNVRFDVADLQDLGITTYRVFGGMQRWEAQDDDGVYGSPTVAEIKANPNVVNWAWWDEAMTNPPRGTDYWWSGDENLWPGNARTIFGALKAAGIRPVLTIRNRDNHHLPAWAPDPPRTEADCNEWWEHVFATVYWLNVRNDYRVDDFEVHNEPDNRSQGWSGTQAEYLELVKSTKDAIDHVYRTYLPGRVYHVHAPVTVTGSTWPREALNQVGDRFDSVNIHNYDADITSYTRKVHSWMNSAGRGHDPLWVSEWGTFEDRYDSIPFDVGVVKNMIRGSRPGDDYIYGSHIFTLYDWDGFGTARYENFQGLIGPTGARRPGYYAFRLAARALQGCRPTFQSTSNNRNLLAIATRSADGRLYLLVANGSRSTYAVDADLSAHLARGAGTMWLFDAGHMDVIVGAPAVNDGHVAFSIPSRAAVMIEFTASTTPTAQPAGPTVQETFPTT
jgi:hypothetical protein